MSVAQHKPAGLCVLEPGMGRVMVPGLGRAVRLGVRGDEAEAQAACWLVSCV